MIQFAVKIAVVVMKKHGGKYAALRSKTSADDLTPGKATEWINKIREPMGTLSGRTDEYSAIAANPGKRRK